MIGTALTIVAAPSRATPQMGLKKSRRDFHQAAALAGTSGVAGATEIMRQRWRKAWREAFGGSAIQPTKPCMSPIGYGHSTALLHSGSGYGCGAVLGVNAKRDYAWAVVQVTGPGGTFTIGHIAAHMPPGAYNAGTPIQRLRTGASKVQWGVFDANIAAERDRMRKLYEVDLIVTTMDDNRPGYDHPGDDLHWRDGVTYVGVENVSKVKIDVLRERALPQHADHKALVAELQLAR